MADQVKAVGAPVGITLGEVAGVDLLGILASITAGAFGSPMERRRYEEQNLASGINSLRSVLDLKIKVTRQVAEGGPSMTPAQIIMASRPAPASKPEPRPTRIETTVRESGGETVVTTRAIPAGAMASTTGRPTAGGVTVYSE